MALAGLAGCASVEYSSPEALKDVAIKGVTAPTAEHVVVVTTGYYFLWTVPLCSGDLRWDEERATIKGGTRFFRDMVGAQEIKDALLKIAESRNCDLADVTLTDGDSTFAGLSEAGLIKAFFGSSDMVISAVLVPRDGKEAK